MGLYREVREIAERTAKETVKAVMPALIAMAIKKRADDGNANANAALARYLAEQGKTYDEMMQAYEEYMNPKPKPRTFRNLWGLLS